MRKILLVFLSFAAMWACTSPEVADNTKTEQTSVQEAIANDLPEVSKAEIATRAVELCKHLPESVCLDYEPFMTAEFLGLYKEAQAIPTYTLDIPGNEFLYEMVRAGEITPEFFVAEDDVTIINEALAKVDVEVRFDDYVKKSVLTMEKVDGRWLTADFDDTKRMCKEYIESERKMLESGEAEESFRSEGASDEQIEEFNSELEEFYKQYGK